MINRIYKLINNKFSGFFKFVFLIRYLFLIFFVAISLFLIIPQFFNYAQKEQIIKEYLNNNYSIEIKKIENIKYGFFPTPYLQIKNFKANIFSEKINIEAKNLILYPELLSIYNYENFRVKKIKVDDGNININFKDVKFLLKKILSLKKKISFKNFNTKIKQGENSLIDLEKINFINYGYKKNTIIGEIFNRKFKINFENSLQNLKFEIIDTGIITKLKVTDSSILKNEGQVEGKILKSNFKFNFIYDKKLLEIKNFYFRDKNLSFNSNGNIKLKPFFKANFNSEINSINTDILKNLDIERILNFKDLIKRLNSENNIFMKSKKFSRNLIEDLSLNIKLAYGNLFILKDLNISNSKFNCRNNINLLDENPIFYFNCNLNSPNKKDLLKRFNIDIKEKKEKIDLIVQGNINIFNKKINFDNIEMNKTYKATNEDLKYFKTSFENILFDKRFLDIFNQEKIKKFLLEIL